jgi:hypothetical protein
MEKQDLLKIPGMQVGGIKNNDGEDKSKYDCKTFYKCYNDPQCNNKKRRNIEFLNLLEPP